MAWSTREIAELAGTSLRAVRHYHEVGLLDEPVRRANGYKQYGVAHLVRLLRIKRLVDLGFSLSQIAEMGDADDHPGEALRALDAELAATIGRLQRARMELGFILKKSVPADLPPEFATAAAGTPLPEAERSFVTVMSRVLGPKGIAAYAELLRNPVEDPAGDAFHNCPPTPTSRPAPRWPMAWSPTCWSCGGRTRGCAHCPPTPRAARSTRRRPSAAPSRRSTTNPRRTSCAGLASC
ncbi:MerR family transcriptional regulator [Streptomyces noursei]|uniref:helix-turn-helix domain-containing protein n=1 Tax=Streptomyces noursei TaxID=1971 RepID=UPI002155669E|nr:MerR family transcriptional regulator [Streptomyces noursei]